MIQVSETVLDPDAMLLPAAIDPLFARERITTCLPDAQMKQDKIDCPDIDVIKYKPEDRCVTKVVFSNRAEKKNTSKGEIFYGKTFDDGRGVVILDHVRYLHARSEKSLEAFRFPAPVGYDKKLKTVWLKELPGTPLQYIIHRGNYQKLMIRIAQGLVHLQCLKIPSAPLVELENILATTRGKIDEMRFACPACRSLLRRLSEDLPEKMKAFTPVPPRLLHGDFKLRQLIVDDNNIGLLDFDHLRAGDPMQDVADFLVDLNFQGFDNHFVYYLHNFFLYIYRQNAPWDVAHERLFWHLRVQLIKKAYHFYRERASNWFKKIEDAVNHLDQFV